MTVLRDQTINDLVEKYELITPFKLEQLQPASYDVLLGDKILAVAEPFGVWMFGSHRDMDPYGSIDLSKPLPEDLYHEVDITDGYKLHSFQFVLGSTVERVQIRNDMVGRIEGKSSIGRLGLTAHITAGYLDPGFCGNITLELANLFPRPLVLKAGMRIAQLGFELLDGPCRCPYGSPELGSHYQYADGVEGSRYEA